MKNIPIIGKIIKDDKLGNRVIYKCETCGKECHQVYKRPNSKWNCEKCHVEAIK